MDLETRLARELIRRQPERAARVLERSGVAEAVRTLTACSPQEAIDVLRRTAPFFGAAVLEALPPERAARLLGRIEVDVAAGLLRRVKEEGRELVLERISEPRAASLRTLLRFAEGTAGALLDPEVLALPQDLAAEEALSAVREAPERARYNLYVVDREQRLVGALNLRELLLAPPRARLAELMVSEPLRLAADADRIEVIGHRGWKEVHSLPVVDEAGRYLGALRYRTLRELEAELLGVRGEDDRAAEALGELFAAGARGLLEALNAGRSGVGPES